MLGCPHKQALGCRDRAGSRIRVTGGAVEARSSFSRWRDFSSLLLLSAGLIRCLGRKQATNHMDNAVVGHDVLLQNLDVVD